MIVDECGQNNFLNVGTGKLHVKDHMEKWSGTGKEILENFLLLLLFYFMFVFLALILLSFYRNSSREVFWKLYIFRINCKNF